jgi:hypothetical protein
MNEAQRMVIDAARVRAESLNPTVNLIITPF